MTDPPTWWFLMWRCICAWCEGELVEPPLLEPAELMEHMELFLLPRLEGEEGGVWKITPPSADLMSLKTYRDSQLLCGDVDVLKLYLSINPCEAGTIQLNEGTL